MNEDHTSNTSTPPEPTETRPRRSAETERVYGSRYRAVERAALIRLKYYGYAMEDWESTPADAKDIVDQLIIFSSEKKSRDFSYYKTAVLHRFYQYAERTKGGDLDKLKDLISKTIEISPPRTDSYSKRETGIYRKRMPESDLKKIRSHLMLYHGKKIFGFDLLIWIDATIATGLRPNEWEDARIEMLDTQGQGAPTPHLVCKNSKRKVAAPAFFDIEKARAEHPDLEIRNVFDLQLHGIESTFFPRKMSREIPLTQEQAEVVGKHLGCINKAADKGIPFEKHYETCRKLFERVCLNLFKGKRTYSLYSLRHQYAANGKMIHSREALAELMGHDSVQTGQAAYASGRHAHADFKEIARTKSNSVPQPIDKSEERPG